MGFWLGVGCAADVVLKDGVVPVETGIFAVALLQEGATERPISKTQAIVPREKLKTVRIVLFIHR